MYFLDPFLKYLATTLIKCILCIVLEWSDYCHFLLSQDSLEAITCVFLSFNESRNLYICSYVHYNLFVLNFVLSDGYNPRIYKKKKKETKINLQFGIHKPMEVTTISLETILMILFDLMLMFLNNASISSEKI